MQDNVTTDAAKSWLDHHRAVPQQAGLANEHATPRTLDTSATQTPEQRAAAEALRLLEIERTKAG